ncbi:uncharacterized protein LOC142350413 [Convolutriloba macropyga]|uniref:uncharacterized protein LOC142350413 n=1 Tax=Convolutriloba macropyga TaxID=536237 RepID=UPI003F51F21C
MFLQVFYLSLVYSSTASFITKIYGNLEEFDCCASSICDNHRIGELCYYFSDSAQVYSFHDARRFCQGIKRRLPVLLNMDDLRDLFHEASDFFHHKKLPSQFYLGFKKQTIMSKADLGWEVVDHTDDIFEYG